MTRCPVVHRFDSEQSAYNDSQCRNDVHDGDVLLTPDSCAILVAAWPTRIWGPTGRGVFHELKEGVTWNMLDGGKYRGSAVRAFAMQRMGKTLHGLHNGRR